MASMSFFDILKFTYKVLEFKYQQNKLTTRINEVVETPKGSVKGVKRLNHWGDSYYSFEKIPYAKPPLGELRFRAPLPADPWDTVLDCTGPAEKPLQTNALFYKYKGSEDCLYLNVFTNNITPELPRPVMVWIYGGGFQLGEASRDMYSPDYFMSKDVVLVTIAYRLGAFGFLSLDDPAINIPGNAGIKDQILSLKWVKENIAYFGGDPNNVTLFGESAGGASTHLCMLTEQSKGLIHKGVVMSGTALCPWATTPNARFAYRLAKSLGYEGEDKDSDVYNYLLNCKGPDLVRGSGLVLSKEEKHNRVLFSFVPVVEPYVTEQCILSEDPYEVMKKTWSNQIPMMLGGTSFEGLLFHPEVTRRPATLDEVKNCKNLLPTDLKLDADGKETEEYAMQLKEEFFGQEQCSRETVMKFLDIESYREFWHPIYRTALSRIKYATAPTYLYRFDYDSKVGNVVRIILCGREMRGVCHGDDIYYLFNSMLAYRASKDSEEYQIIRAMIDIWTSFAKNSDPNCDMLGGVKFEPLAKDAETMKCLNISEKMEFIDLPELQKIKVWNSFYPQGKL